MLGRPDISQPALPSRWGRKILPRYSRQVRLHQIAVAIFAHEQATVFHAPLYPSATPNNHYGPLVQASHAMQFYVEEGCCARINTARATV